MQDQLWQGGPWERSGPAAAPRSEQKRRKKRRNPWPVIGAIAAISTAALALVVIAAAVMTFFRYPDLVQRRPRATSQPLTSLSRAPTGDGTRLTLYPKGEEVLTLQQIYERTLPSIVYIHAAAEKEVSAGSGVVMSQDGYILTNWHVVEGANAAQVLLWDDTVLDAMLVGQSEIYDLAVLKVKADGLVPAQFATTADVQVGDSVVAIGNPLGQRLRGTMTEGIISAVDRSMDMDGAAVAMLQTSAALNPGNSGGALVNDRGQVIGITTLKMISHSQNIEGLGFAIPSRLIKGLTDQIIATGRAGTPMLGVTLSAQRQPVSGLRVVSVRTDCDAWSKGIRPGDVLLRADGVELPEVGVLAGMKQELGVGDEMELTVWRDGQIFTVRVVLADAEDLK